MSRKQDNYSSISDFIGTEMNGSIVVDAKQRTISDHGKYIRVRQDFTLENGGWSWKEVFQDKPNNMSATNMAEETKDKDDEANQEEVQRTKTETKPNNDVLNIESKQKSSPIPPRRTKSKSKKTKSKHDHNPGSPSLKRKTKTKAQESESRDSKNAFSPSPLARRKSKSKRKQKESSLSKGNDSPGSIVKSKKASKKKAKKSKAAPGKLKNIFAEEIDLEAPYKRPVYIKTKAEKKTISRSVKDTISFKGFGPSQMAPIMDAFEPVTYSEGDTISKQGDLARFYSIVHSGSVDFYSDGKQVGAAAAGETFGGIALQSSNPQPVSVIATDNKTVLLQLDNTHFRRIVKDEMVRTEDEKLRLLKLVPMFNILEEEDLRLLSSTMVEVRFKEGEDMSRKFKEMPFCIVKEGLVVATDQEYGAGQAFNVDTLDQRDTKTLTKKVRAVTDGTAYIIDEDSFRKVFGDFKRVKRKHQDKATISMVRSIRESGILGSQLQDLVSQMCDKTFEQNEEIFATDTPTAPIMYFVRQGKVSISKKDGNVKILNPGDYFGHEHLRFQEKKKRKVVPQNILPEYSAKALTNILCGMITLDDLAAVTGQSSQKTDKDTHIELKDLERLKVIGEGQFGVVWLVKNSKSQWQELLALKVQNFKSKSKVDRAKNIRKETKIMKALQHKFIIKLLNVYKEPDCLSMLMDFAPGGELFDVIHRQDADGYWISGLDENVAKFYAAVIADTLAFMHKQKYIYRDIKPENILLDKDGYPLITDFGFAKKLSKGKTYTFCGTPNFVAPEVILLRGHDQSADNWSLGVLIYELIDGENPFWDDGMDNETLFDVVCNSPYFPLAEERVSLSARHLIYRLLEKNPGKRLGSFREKDILEHQWFEGIDIHRLRKKAYTAPKVPPPFKCNDNLISKC